MKKFLCGFLSGLILAGTLSTIAAISYTASPVDFKVMVNGEEFKSNPPALEVEGRTYLPLRAIGEALGVPVNWNEELRQAEVGTVTASSTDNASESEPDVPSYSYYPNSDIPDFGNIFGIEPVNIRKEDGQICYVYDFDKFEGGESEAYLEIIKAEGYTLEDLTEADQPFDIVIGALDFKMDREPFIISVFIDESSNAYFWIQFSIE